MTAWHCQQGNTELTKIHLQNFDCQNSLSSCNLNANICADKKCSQYYEKLTVPNEIILVDGRGPPWITSKLKSAIQEKNLFYRKYLRLNNQETLQAISQIQERVRLGFENSKKNYYEKRSNKLSNDKLGGNLLLENSKTFFNGKKNSLHSFDTS